MDATAAVSEILVMSWPRAVRHRGTARAWGGQRGAVTQWEGEPNAHLHLTDGPRPGPLPGRRSQRRVPAPFPRAAPDDRRGDGPTALRSGPWSRPRHPT